MAYGAGRGALITNFLLLKPPAPLARTKGLNAMNDTMGMEQIEQDILAFEVADEALEIAGGKEKAGSFTLGACTGLSVCDG